MFKRLLLVLCITCFLPAAISCSDSDDKKTDGAISSKDSQTLSDGAISSTDGQAATGDVLVSSDTSSTAGETTNWNLTAEVDLDGKFPVEATLKITANTTTFSAEIHTTKIGGAAEEHDVQVDGTIQDGKFSVKDAKFTIQVGSGYSAIQEEVTLNGEFTMSTDKIEGNGTVKVIQSGSTETLNGTFTVSGTPQ